jgi:hypothetical protein
VGRGKETGGGMLRIFSTADPAKYPVIKLAEHSDAKQWISDVKFSSDGRTVVIGKYVSLHVHPPLYAICSWTF